MPRPGEYKERCIRGSIRVTRSYKKSACYCEPCTRHRLNVEYARRKLRGVKTTQPSGARKLVYKAKHRAKERGLPFDLKPEDIVVPDKCPVLGIEMWAGNGRMSDHSPTLDRIIPAKGYVRGNVAVISHKANRLKSDASLDDLRALVAYMEHK